jgi:hypothetical protein
MAPMKTKILGTQVSAIIALQFPVEKFYKKRTARKIA